MKKELFDDFLKEKLKNHELRPPENIWLNVNIGTQKHNHVRIYYPIAASFLLLLLGMYLWMHFDNQTVEHTQVAIHSEIDLPPNKISTLLTLPLPYSQLEKNKLKLSNKGTKLVIIKSNQVIQNSLRAEVVLSLPDLKKKGYIFPKTPTISQLPVLHTPISNEYMIAEGLNHSNTKRKVSSKTRKLRTHKTEQFIKWMALISNLSAGKFIADVRTAKDQFIYNNLSVKK